MKLRWWGIYQDCPFCCHGLRTCPFCREQIRQHKEKVKKEQAAKGKERR